VFQPAHHCQHEGEPCLVHVAEAALVPCDVLEPLLTDGQAGCSLQLWVRAGVGVVVAVGPLI
jgi:hypothetical protein